MALRDLILEDEALIKSWLEPYLKQHVSWWQEAYGSKSERSLNELVERDWKGLVKAKESENRFVRVYAKEKPLGIVEALVEKDHFLHIAIGILGWIYVAEDARKQGIADQLMEAALNWMKEKKVKGRLVNVTAFNTSAVKLYEKHGFKVVDYRMLGKAP